MPRFQRGEAGSVTAEFALLMPAVLLVIATVLGGAQLASLQLRLGDAAAGAARAIARGDAEPTVRQQVAQLVAGSVVVVRQQGDYTCVSASGRTASGPLALLPALTGVGCALRSVG